MALRSRRPRARGRVGAGRLAEVRVRSACDRQECPHRAISPSWRARGRQERSICDPASSTKSRTPLPKNPPVVTTLLVCREEERRRSAGGARPALLAARRCNRRPASAGQRDGRRGVRPRLALLADRNRPWSQAALAALPSLTPAAPSARRGDSLGLIAKQRLRELGGVRHKRVPHTGTICSRRRADSSRPT